MHSLGFYLSVILKEESQSLKVCQIFFHVILVQVLRDFLYLKLFIFLLIANAKA